MLAPLLSETTGLFGATYLNVVDMVSIPGSTKELVTESQDEQIFNHLLSKVMVDTENFLLPPVRFEGLLKVPRTL